MRKIILFVPLLIAWASAGAQSKIIVSNLKNIPKSIKYKGRIVDAAKYTDATGQYLIFTTETGELRTDKTESDFREAELHAYHYAIKENNFELTWQMSDYVKDCPVDIVANYVPKTFAITDLDKNGKAEVWLMFKTICRGDVSPSNMKIIMHEGTNKYAIRGTNKVKLSAKDVYGGEYALDNAFKAASKDFRDYAIDLWNKNVLETWK